MFPLFFMLMLFYANIANSELKTSMMIIFAHYYLSIGFPYLYFFAQYMFNLAEVNMTFERLESKLISIQTSIQATLGKV